MEPETPTRGQVSVDRVLNETYSIYTKNAGPLLGSALAVFAVVGLVSGLLEATGSLLLAFIGTVIQLGGHALYTGFVVHLVQDVRDGKRDSTVGDLFSAASPAIPALIAFGILFGIGVFVGFLFLVIPGLVLLTFWAVGAPAIVAENRGPIEAFGRSWRLVSGQAWSVFLTMFVIFLIVVAVTLVLILTAASIGLGAVILASIVSSVLTAPIFSAASTVIFFELGGGATTPAATEPDFGQPVDAPQPMDAPSAPSPGSTPPPTY